MSAKFTVGQKVNHNRFGAGRIVAVYALATNANEETEYTVKLRSERYSATLAESNLTAA